MGVVFTQATGGIRRGASCVILHVGENSTRRQQLCHHLMRILPPAAHAITTLYYRN
jgi:hypothetical protein